MRKVYYFNRNNSPKVKLDPMLALRIANRNLYIAYGIKDSKV